jgi:hypothetical protein
MSRTLVGLKAALGNDLRAAGDAMGLAVALTDTELVTAKAKLFGSPTLTRYPLNELRAVELVPNPSANRLQIHIGSQNLMVLYGPESGADFEQLIALLKKRLGGV